MIQEIKNIIKSETKALQILWVVVGLLVLLSFGVLLTGLISEIWNIL